MHDNALSPAVRLHYFYDIMKPWLQNYYDEMEKVSMSIRHSLLKIDTLQKIRKDEDASHN